MTLLHHPSFNPWKEFDRIFGPVKDDASWTPSFDIVETDQAFVLRGDLPGVPQKGIEVRLEDDVLTVRGERKIAPPEGEPRFIRLRRPSGKFLRRFALPKAVNRDEVKATFVNGVLELVIPKQEPVDTSRLIAVN